MRRFGLLAWPLLLCYFSLGLTVLARDGGDNEDVRLKVSIQKESLKKVSSSQHTFSQLEFINLHPTESIMIHSIQTAPEETILIRSVSGQVVGSTWDSIPQQFHVSRLPSGSLSLGPGQVAIVPLTFLPRYPDFGHDNPIAVHEVRETPGLSSAARLDLIDMLGENVVDSLESQQYYPDPSRSARRRSNLHPSSLPAADEFKVTTSIVVDTSRGILQMPVSATTKRQNLYAIPDMIQFHHSSFGHYDGKSIAEDKNASPRSLASIAPDGTFLLHSIPFDQSRSKKSSSNVPSSKHSDPVRDCYDIYMNNPSLDTDLEISEVLVSRPDLMSVEFDPSRLLLPQSLLVLESPPSHGIRDWTEEGAMYLSADSCDNYIATVCTAPHGVEEDPVSSSYLEEMAGWLDLGSPDLCLGFLQIRTDADILFISLQSYPTLENTNQSAFPSDLMTNTNLSLPSSQSSLQEQLSLLKATPDKLEFLLVSSVTTPSSVGITLQNKSPVPIRIMRVSLSMDGDQERDVIDEIHRLGLKINVTQGDMGDSEEIPAASSASNIVWVTCEANPPPSSMKSFHYTGSIVIRGTADTELQYDEWKEETSRDLHRDSHVTLEIPYSISVLNGRIEVTLERSTHPYPQIFSAQPWDRSGRAVSTLFFPLAPFDALDNSELPLPTQKYMNSREIGHDLRIMSNMPTPLSLHYAEIVDEHELSVQGTMSSPCSRFNVSRARPFGTNMAYPGFEDLGFLSLQYKFESKSDRQRRQSRSEGEERFLPITCYLNIVTSPADTGIHRVPLVVFPAELEIASPSHLGKRNIPRTSNQDRELPTHRNDQETVITGYDNLLAWLHTSAVGQAFLHCLPSVLETRKQSASQLLFKYLQKLLGSSEDTGLAGVKPVLLNIGAIEHGQIAKIPLVLTNHNPIPLTISMDSDKVEGMAIELVRGLSQRRGVGNNIFDFLPKADDANANSEGAVINEGHFKGHPVYGLRQFLLSNRYTQEFSSLFPLRDAVYQSQDAIDMHPFLQTLYQWHSYAQFHRYSHSETGENIESGTCGLSMQPPLFQPDQANNKDSLSPGPIIVSADKSLLRPLQVCSDRMALSIPRGKTTIPPGGSARLEVRVRSPPVEFLKNDVSQVLATGLVLSTTFGQLIPIFATFEALQGQLHLHQEHHSVDELAEYTTNNLNQTDDVIRVPLGLHWQSSIDYDDSVHGMDISRSTSGSTDSGIPLYVSSSFSHQVRIRDIQSCNPWFHIRLRNSTDGIDIATNTGTNIGTLHSTAFCHPPRGRTLAYPSFYQCVLNWLTSRHELQPTGCGSVSTHSTSRRDEEIGIDMNRGYRHIIKTFENVVSDSIMKFTALVMPHAGSSAIGNTFYSQQEGSSAIKSGAKKSDGYIDVTSLNVYAEALDAWDIADEIGLTRLSSNLRATIEYFPSNLMAHDGNQTRESQSLTLSMHDFGIESTLSAPSLLAGSMNIDAATTMHAPILYFPATMVGSVASMIIPLQNPTAVPVRVRLVAASAPTDSVTTSIQKPVTDGFLQGLQSPYVQNGSGRYYNESSSDHLWWEGGGAFFLSDKEGNVIRSQHNMSIRAGAGAHVSLVNPSLHSVSAFVLGCAGRCGLRDEQKASDDLFDIKHFSAIGASAAASITLVGRQRSTLPQLNDLSSDEPFVYTGGTPIPGDGRPQPFAIPFSSLDEIVLPPYGTGEIGPILFRPPGRTVALGCDVVKHSKSRHWGVKAGKLCETEAFSSMILLENSLTGIERIEIRGRSQWEHLYFLDPPARDNGDAFGDIELRNGRTTLVFDGSGSSSPGFGDLARITPVIKQVVLHNGGDVTISIESIYLSDTHKMARKSRATLRSSRQSCRRGSFRLLDCWESDRGFYMVDGFPVKNVRSGFELNPGESRSLYMEHEAHCRKREEFVSLNVDFFGQTRPTSQNSALNFQTSLDASARRLSGRDGPFLTKKVELILGYSMNSLQFAKCSPVNDWNADYVIVETSSSNKIEVNATRHRRLARNRLQGHLHWITKYLHLLLFTTLMAMLSTMVVAFGQLRHQALERSNAKTRTSNRLDTKNGSEKKRASQQSLWNATFRCLARADPTSIELQALGREQIKQVVACRYRAKGGSPPTSLFNAGVFIRERPGVIAPGGKARQQTGKESSGTDRVRTLSDALLRTYSSEVGDSVRHLIPSGLGWRVAFANGIISEKSVQAIAITKTTENLVERRSRGSLSDHTPDLVEGYESDAESFETEKNVGRKIQDKVEPLSSPSVSVVQNETSDAKASDDTADDEANKSGLQWTKKQPKKTEKTQKEVSNKQQRHSKVNDAITDAQTSSQATIGSLVPSKSLHDSGLSSSNGRKQVVPRNHDLPSSKTSHRVGGSTSSDELRPALQENEIRRNSMMPSWKQSDGLSQNEPSTPEVKSTSQDRHEASSRREVSGGGAAPAIVATQDASTFPMLHHGISPPPGLAPPPGFDRDVVSDVFASPTIDLSFSTSIDAAEAPSSAVLSEPILNPDLGNLKNSSSCPSLAFPQPMSTELLFGSQLNQTPTYAASGSLGFGVNASPPIRQHEDEATTKGDPLLDALLYDRDNSHNGFDVMDFLDSILDDGGSSEQRSSEHTSPPPGLLMGASAGFLTSNPWASEHRSRASAYGIAFDDTPSDGGDEPNDGPGIPLLTPAAFLLDDDDDGDDDQRAFSFYARLTDEE